jgi:ribonuclease BN (tRNA processing enzyme)
MELIALGSGTAIPRPKRSPAGYAVQVGQELLLLDSGPGTLGRLAQAGLDYAALNHVFYTHLHADHTADLIALLAAAVIPGHERLSDLEITGPRGMRDFVARLLQLYPSLEPAPRYNLAIREMNEEYADYGHWQVLTKPLPHTANSIGYRLTAEDKAIVYSGDTEYCQNIIALAQNADLLVLECSFPNGQGRAGHLTPRECGAIATAARARRLLLTHFYPECEGVDIAGQCRAAYDGEVIVADDLLRIDV